MPAIYDGLIFRTALDAQWAGFFDLAGWSWHYNPKPIGNWVPEFRVTFPCRHSECSGSHSLAVAVVPMADLEGLGGHPALRFAYGLGADEKPIGVDAGALFGSTPDATTWEMSHGAGGGPANVPFWVDEAAGYWHQARSLVTVLD
ncbi:MAG: hypothetical protein V4795_02660 [Pseudomonadota bacterium]